MSEYYILNGNRTPVPVDVMTWAEWFQNFENRRVDSTRIGNVEVSTVFLGSDHNFLQEGPPLIFETMVFGLDDDEICVRCSTWEQAEQQHRETVDRVWALKFRRVTP